VTTLRLSALKGAMPQIAAQEVKSISFRLQEMGGSEAPLSSVVREVVEEWLSTELGASPISELWHSSARATLHSDSGQELAKLAYQVIQDDQVEVFELQVINKFFRGYEVTRLRFLSLYGESHLQISSFIELQDKNRLAEEVPLISDSFGPALFASDRVSLSIDGEASVQPFPFGASRNDFDSLKRLQQGRGPLPLIVVRASELSSSDATRISVELFGLAHTVLVEGVPAVNVRPKLSVYWRDGSDEPSVFDLSSQRFRLSIQLRALRSRTDSFPVLWHRAANSVNRPILQGSITDKEPTKQLALIEELRSRLEASEFARKRVEEDFSGFQLLFDQENAELREKNEDLLRQLSVYKQKYFELSDSLNVASTEPRPDLNPNLRRNDIDAMLDELVSKCGGAIAFTSGVSKTWRQAVKNGYDKPKKMEKALANLCLIAYDYRMSNGDLGGPLDEFAKLNYETELILFDSLESPDFEYQGELLRQEPHVKADAGNTVGRLGRIHFGIDRNNLRLVVNHMGSKIHPYK